MRSELYMYYNYYYSANQWLCSLYRGSQGKGSEAFTHSLHDLLLTVCAMMKLEGKENELIAPRAQAQALQFFPQTFDLFLSVLDIKSLG